MGCDTVKVTPFEHVQLLSDWESLQDQPFCCKYILRTNFKTSEVKRTLALHCCGSRCSVFALFYSDLPTAYKCTSACPICSVDEASGQRTTRAISIHESMLLSVGCWRASPWRTQTMLSNVPAGSMWVHQRTRNYSCVMEIHWCRWNTLVSLYSTSSVLNAFMHQVSITLSCCLHTPLSHICSVQLSYPTW